MPRSQVEEKDNRRSGKLGDRGWPDSGGVMAFTRPQSRLGKFVGAEGHWWKFLRNTRPPGPWPQRQQGKEGPSSRPCSGRGNAFKTHRRGVFPRQMATKSGERFRATRKGRRLPKLFRP
jgi:hypothetical protein